MSNPTSDYTPDAIDKVAEEMYNYACAVRASKKEGVLGDPRNVGCEYKDLFDEPKKFYRTLATWCINNPQSS